MKIGDKLNTPKGKGEIVDIEFYSGIDGGKKRYGVKLHNNPFFIQWHIFGLKKLKR